MQPASGTRASVDDGSDRRLLAAGDVALIARAASLALVLLLGVIVARNAFVYPPIGGYDAAEHISYARGLAERGELPDRVGSYYTPPLWYALAGGGMRLGEWLGLDEPERMGQLLNAALVVGTALLVLVLARTLFPGRPLISTAAVAFFVACPLTIRMGTMFHPQALALFLSTAGLLVVARLVAAGRYSLGGAALAGLCLGAAELVRSVAIWSYGVAVIVLFAAVVLQPAARRRAARALGVVLVLGVLVPLPWYVHLQQSYGYAIFGRPPTGTPPAQPAPPVTPAPAPAPTPSQPSPGSVSPAPAARHDAPLSFYLGTGLPEVITSPHRDALPRDFLPIVYADSWGDVFGAWAWGPTRDPLPEVEDRLVLQSLAGIPVTFVAVAGWVALAALAWRGRRRVELLLVVGLPAAALVGMGYYGSRSYESEVDFVKGMFAITAVPFWALSFAFAAEALWHRLPRVPAAVLGLLLAVCLALCLEFGVA
jgi:hypothetical protein